MGRSSLARSDLEALEGFKDTNLQSSDSKMNLNALKAQRKGLRTAFSNCLKKIESELAQELCNFEILSVLKIQFNDKFARMDSCQNAISETLLLSDDGERLFAEDLEDAEIYRESSGNLLQK
ncbi:hypothetical protein TNCV_3485591 [Trichonephila clavipes]|nr:hypothetical protein TNCV_3485591 [Trichonephila clavipes]